MLPQNFQTACDMLPLTHFLGKFIAKIPEVAKQTAKLYTRVLGFRQIPFDITLSEMFLKLFALNPQRLVKKQTK